MLRLTWIRFYGVVKAHSITMNAEKIWDIDALGRSFGIEQYSRNAATGGWYTAPPPWNIAIDAYDSRDIQRFQGQPHGARVADILNSAKWRAFLISTLPNATAELAKNNSIQVELRMANDVITAIKASMRTVQHTEAGVIAAEEAATA